MKVTRQDRHQQYDVIVTFPAIAPDTVRHPEDSNCPALQFVLGSLESVYCYKRVWNVLKGIMFHKYLQFI